LYAVPDHFSYNDLIVVASEKDYRTHFAHPPFVEVVVASFGCSC